MSWLELDDQILNHPKFIRAVKLGGSETVHMWLGIRAYCGQNLTNGFVPTDMIDEVRGPLNAKKRSVALKILLDVQLLDSVDGGLLMHDYLDWSKSRDSVLEAREKARERKAKSREPSRRDIPRDSERDNAVTPPSVPAGVTKPRARARAGALLSSPLLSDPEEEIPLPPSEPGKNRPDPFATSFLPVRADVLELHEHWKRTTGLTAHRLRGPSDMDAVTLAEALDAHGLPECLAVLAVAMGDPMVTGQADERGQKHRSIRYIFGNEHTFARLALAAVEQARRAQPKEDPIERARNAKPDLSDYVAPPDEVPCPQP